MDEIMDIYCDEGTKVKFVNEGGWNGEFEEAKKYLKQGEIYTVDCVDIGDWTSYVILKEFPTKEFNTILFAEVGEE